MKWIEITDKNLPPFKKDVLITDVVMNEEEYCFITAIGALDGVWHDESGTKPSWTDPHNSGVITPTHYCEIPELKIENQ